MAKFLLKCLTLCLFPLLARIAEWQNVACQNHAWKLQSLPESQNRAITECLEIKMASAVNQICRFGLTKSSRNLTVACHRHPTEQGLNGVWYCKGRSTGKSVTTAIGHLIDQPAAHYQHGVGGKERLGRVKWTVSNVSKNLMSQSWHFIPLVICKYIANYFKFNNFKLGRNDSELGRNDLGWNGLGAKRPVSVFAMLPAHSIWRETVSLLDVMWPWTSQWMGAL